MTQMRMHVFIKLYNLNTYKQGNLNYNLADHFNDNFLER